MQTTFPNILSPFFNPLELVNSHLNASKSYQEMLGLVATLQKIALQQQVIIRTLTLKHENNEKMKAAIDKESAEKKLDLPSFEELDKKSGSCTPDDVLKASENLTDELKIDSPDQKKPQIIRRNGFRSLRKPGNSEVKSGKGENSKSNSSKAKHLWVNYGRRIIEYSITQTKGDIQDKTKQLIGKLNSKKDFEHVFKVRASDTPDQKLFKNLIGRLAIYFVKHKSVSSFEGSKYREEMIPQRHVVAAWIERLISE